MPWESDVAHFNPKRRQLHVQVAQLCILCRDQPRCTFVCSGFQLLGSGCKLRTVGYKYQSHHNLFTSKNMGQIASITFTKKRADTVLKLSYSSSIRTVGAGKYLRWYFKIDGQECIKPTPIDIGMYQDTNDNTHIPAVLTGICESIVKSGASLPAGQHTITVHVGQIFNYPIAHGISQWHTTSILEIQEMCPMFWFLGSCDIPFACPWSLRVSSLMLVETCTNWAP